MKTLECFAGIGGMAEGFRLAGFEHIRPGERQHDWEAPRTIEPGVGESAHGLSRRLAGRNRRARLKALGNAVVPQCAEVIARAILEADRRAA